MRPALLVSLCLVLSACAPAAPTDAAPPSSPASADSSSRLALPVPFGPQLTLAWSFDVSQQINPLWSLGADLVIVNLTDDNGDLQVNGADDPDMALVIVDEFGTPMLTLFDAMDPTSVHWVVLGADPYGPLVAGDLSGDGISDIIFQDTFGYLQAIDHAGVSLWTSAVPLAPLARNTIALGDVDGVGAVHVVAGNTLYDGGSGAVLRTFGSSMPGPSQLEIGDLTGNGQLELLVGDTLYDANGTVRWQEGSLTSSYPHTATMIDADGSTPGAHVFALAGDRLSVVDRNGLVVEQHTLASGANPGQDTWCLGDFDGDGAPEVARTSGQTLFSGPEIGQVSELDGTQVWQQTFLPSTSGPVSGGCAAVDVDGDGRDEVVFHGDTGMSVRDGRTGAVLQSWATSGYASPPRVADVDGDGWPEFVLVTGTRIEVLNESNGAWRGGVQPAWLGGNHSPARLGVLGATPGAAWFSSDVVRGN